MTREQEVIEYTKEFSKDRLFYNCTKEQIDMLKSKFNLKTLELYIDGAICMVNHFKGRELNGQEKWVRFGLSKKLYFMVAKELENGNI